jgi:hypothetical protein
MDASYCRRYRLRQKKQFRKIIDDILNLLDTKEYVNPSEIGDKARVRLVSSYS